MNDTHFLRSIAIILIVNSHLDMFYPKPFFATGGMIGNSLFFMLSVYGLFLSQKKNNRGFKEYMSRRISRIYPSVWVTLVLAYIPYRIVTGEYSAESTLQYIGAFFYPPFWFLQAIMVFYILEYFIIKRHSPKKNVWMIGFSAAFYAYYYLNFLDLSTFSISGFPFRLIFFLNVVLFGILVASCDVRRPGAGLGDLLLCVLFTAVIYLHKFMMVKHLLPHLQLIQHAAVFPLLFFSLRFAGSSTVQRIMDFNGCATIVRFLSSHTLEIYMAHTCLRQPFVDLDIVYPLNIFMFISASLLFAVIIKGLSQRLSLYIAAS